MTWKGDGAVFSTRKTFGDAAVLALGGGECETKEYQEEGSRIWVPQRMRSPKIR